MGPSLHFTSQAGRGAARRPAAPVEGNERKWTFGLKRRVQLSLAVLFMLSEVFPPLSVSDEDSDQVLELPANFDPVRFDRKENQIPNSYKMMHNL